MFLYMPMSITIDNLQMRMIMVIRHSVRCKSIWISCIWRASPTASRGDCPSHEQRKPFGIQKQFCGGTTQHVGTTRVVEGRNSFSLLANGVVCGVPPPPHKYHQFDEFDEL